MSDTTKMIEQYDALVERALEIVSEYNTGFHVYITEPALSRLSINGDVATLSYAEMERDYDSDILRVSTVEFPADMLIWTDAKMKQWRKDLRVIAEKQQKEAAAAWSAKKDAEERAAYEALKRKFEK